MRGTGKRWRILLATVAAVVIVGLGAYLLLIQAGLLPSPIQRQPAPFPTPAATRDERWLQDIDYYADQLPYLHANAFHTLPRADFEAQVNRLRTEVPTLSDTTILTRLQGITASLGEGHTESYLFDTGQFPLFPLQFRWYGDDLVVTAAAPGYEEVIGARVLAFGETDTAAAQVAVAPLISRDNAQGIVAESPLYLRAPGVLAAVGVLSTAERASLTFQHLDGEPFTLELPLAAVEAANTALLTLYDVFDITPPLRTENPNLNYWYRYLPEDQTLYFHYFRCAEDPARPFEAFAQEMLAFIDSNPVERVVVDVRFNGGGWSGLIRPLLEGIKSRPAVNTRGKLYVLIGRGTFSSALMNAIDFDTQTEAILVGEPTGGAPNGWGEVRTFRLPNSGLEVQYSTRYFTNVPGFQGDALLPDVAVDFAWADLLAGDDPPLDAAIAGVTD